MYTIWVDSLLGPCKMHWNCTYNNTCTNSHNSNTQCKVWSSILRTRNAQHSFLGLLLFMNIDKMGEARFLLRQRNHFHSTSNIIKIYQQGRHFWYINFCVIKAVLRHNSAVAIYMCSIYRTKANLNYLFCGTLIFFFLDLNSNFYYSLLPLFLPSLHPPLSFNLS